jgi:NAD-dependent dihydropyrimidine dehydrogenase PreA subunit
MNIAQRIPIPRIDTRKCTGCGRCVGACPLHLLNLAPNNWVKHAVISKPEACTGCSKCEAVCPFGAIRMDRDTLKR